MSKIEVMKITLFGEVVASSDSLLGFEKQLNGRLVSKSETELFRVFRSVVFDVMEMLSRLHKSSFERFVDFNNAVFNALVNVRKRLLDANTDLRKDEWFLFWDIHAYGNGYKLPIAIIEVTDDGWVNSFEAEFLLNYNPDTKTSSINTELRHMKYILFTQPYIAKYNVKREIAEKLFRTPTSGVAEIQVLTD